MNYQLGYCNRPLIGEETSFIRNWPKWEWKYSASQPCLPIQRDCLAGIRIAFNLSCDITLQIVKTISFSTKLLISDRRNNLGDDIIEAIECLKTWSLAGFGFAGLGSESKTIENALKALEVYRHRQC